ncbi:MAG: hypothetical protein ACC645_16970 [Pirellulales bacterium]
MIVQARAVAAPPVPGALPTSSTSVYLQEKALLSASERRVLRDFRQFLVTPGQMLCFYGPNLAKYKTALQHLTDKEFLVKEQFNGGYSLTQAGFAAMKECS